ncbi:MAG TPA: bifunctional hydroxymethylpyrimidine kinase/phosphomethylpyrimidine kinase, partial [Stellaceae bacterium]|nr:bifunctional hydroxymethylpyrimidine kinase/phosphomethylpyrimidine kinase [Stellaceae bacterium]
MIPRVLVCGGSDSGGGAGIQADIKTVMALGGYAATAVTALTVQNTLGVTEVRPVDAAFVRAQMVAVLDDIGADAVKTGLLPDASVIEAVADELRGRRLKVVVDPVMASSSGTKFVDRAAVDAMRLILFAAATIVTPNLPEAEEITGHKVNDVTSMAAAASEIVTLGAAAALVKGGHLEGSRLYDVLATRGGGILVFDGERIETRGTHGTGCTLASAIAMGLAEGLPIPDAVQRARAYVVRAIREA